MGWGPDPQETRAIVARVGCSLLRELVLPDGEWAYEIDCHTHANKVRLLADLAEFDGRTAAVRRLAERIIAGARSTREQIERLHAFVRDTVVFTGEPLEIFSPTMHTLGIGAGDCDDSARALLALFRSLDLRAGLDTLPAGSDQPLHVAPVVEVDGRWQWAETSVAAELGEHPIAAAKRLGIQTRPELGALGAIPMTEPRTFGNIVAGVAGIYGLAAYSMGWIGATQAGGLAGAAAGWFLYDWPFVETFGDGCSTSKIQESDACVRGLLYRKLAAGAAGAAVGAGLGYAWKRR